MYFQNIALPSYYSHVGPTGPHKICLDRFACLCFLLSEWVLFPLLVQTVPLFLRFYPRPTVQLYLNISLSVMSAWVVPPLTSSFNFRNKFTISILSLRYYLKYFLSNIKKIYILKYCYKSRNSNIILFVLKTLNEMYKVHK